MHLTPGQQVGRLTILETGLRASDGRRLSRCRCECGTEKLIADNALRRSTKSCGCLRRERIAALNRTHGQARRHSQSPEYRCWSNLKDFGLRRRPDLGMDPRWRASFAAFLADMGPRPPGARLWRRDRTRGYHPENCFWAVPAPKQTRPQPDPQPMTNWRPAKARVAGV